MAQSVRNPPTMQETQVQSLGQEDALEKEWQPTPEFLPRKFHAEESGGLQSMGLQIVKHNLATKPPPTKCKEIH